MNNTFNQHIPVLLDEAVAHLITQRDGIYIDATFGRGNHAKAILDKLSSHGRLIAFDKDPEAIAYAQQFFHDPRFMIIHGSYATLQQQLHQHDLVGKISGILFDLGVSSPQLDNPERGFSFSKTGKLDMRMNTAAGISAAEWLASVEENELADILWKFGEERFARRIARAIIAARSAETITTTTQLANIIHSAVPKTKHTYDKHPATRSFQAIRIHINQELLELEQALAQAYTVLALGGRLAAISFHSLEDRIVKQFIRQLEKGDELPRGLPIKGTGFQARVKSIGKPIKPSEEEINLNPRARSAMLRIMEKIS